MMRNELSSFFEDPEFKASLAKYEGMADSHTPCYFDADELVDIAEYYSFKGLHTKAEETIDYALQLHPSQTDVLIFRSRSLALKGKLEEAYQVASLINDPTDREVIFLQADLLMEENRLEEADALLQQLAEREEYSPESITDILLDYMDINLQSYANKWFHELESRYPLEDLVKTNHHIRNVVASYYCQFNENEKAIPLLQQALDDDPYSVSHWTELAKCQLQLNDIAAANEAIDFALAINENDSDVWAVKGMISLQISNSQEAIQCYQKLTQYPEKENIARLALSKIYLDMLDYASSLEQVRLLLNREEELETDEKAELYTHYALCCAAQGKKEEGEGYLRKAREISTYPNEILVSCGRFYLQLLQQSQSEEDKQDCQQKIEDFFGQALKLSITPEERMITLFNIATAYFDAQNLESAASYFECICQEFPPQRKTAYFFLIYCYVYLKDIRKLFSFLANTRKNYPELYEALGNSSNSSLSDPNFDHIIQAIKDDIENGYIYLNENH